MLLAAMLIDALHATLENRIETFNGVSRDNLLAFVAHVLVFAVIDTIVAGETAITIFICRYQLALSVMTAASRAMFALMIGIS